MLASPGVAACARSDIGTAVRMEASTSVAGAAPASPTDKSTNHPASSQPGVLAAPRVPVPANAAVCPQDQPGQTAVAAVADPSAPQITVRVPPGWSVSPGDGDVGATLSGPDDMVAKVTIASTPLEPTAAFINYGDDAMAKYPISTLSLLPGDYCGFSGQRLIGTWAEDPDQSLVYRDRIAHIWTNSGNYFVAVHVEAPTGVPGFDEAAAVLTDKFGIVIP